MTADLERPMIHVNAIADWSGVHAACAPRRGIERLVLPVSDARKSAEFYGRVFGFWPRPAQRDARGGPILVAAHGSAELWLRPCGTACAQSRRWAFVVTDLDEVRERVWELGVKVARDSGDADHIYRRRGGASLYVLDPDGNEIELVERRGADAELDHGAFDRAGAPQRVARGIVHRLVARRDSLAP